MDKIKIQIFYDSKQVSKSGCSENNCSKSSSCSSKSSCSSGHCCKSLDETSTKARSGCGGCSSGGCSKSNGTNHKCCKDNVETVDSLTSFLNSCDIHDKIYIDIYDINKINILDYDNIRVMYEHDMELPYIFIDDILRSYSGISKNLIYKDLKELVKA